MTSIVSPLACSAIIMPIFLVTFSYQILLSALLVVVTLFLVTLLRPDSHNILAESAAM